MPTGRESNNNSQIFSPLETLQAVRKSFLPDAISLIGGPAGPCAQGTEGVVRISASSSVS